MKKAICAGMAVLACLSFCACNAPQGAMPYDALDRTVNEIRSAEKNSVKKLTGGGRRPERGGRGGGLVA